MWAEANSLLDKKYLLPAGALSSASILLPVKLSHLAKTSMAYKVSGVTVMFSLYHSVVPSNVLCSVDVTSCE